MLTDPPHQAASAAARLRRVVKLVRVRGARRSARAALQAYVYARRGWYVFTRQIRPDAHPPPSPDFEYRELGLADLDFLAVFEPSRKRREFRDWLESGGVVFAAFKDGSPVAYQCLSFAVPTGPPLSSLTLRPGQIWTVDVKTLPAYQRHHVARSLRAYRERVLAARGVRWHLSSVQHDNLPALAYAYRAQQWDEDTVALLSYTCLLGVRRIEIEEDARPRLERLLGAHGLLGGGASSTAGRGSAVPGEDSR